MLAAGTTIEHLWGEFDDACVEHASTSSCVEETLTSSGDPEKQVATTAESLFGLVESLQKAETPVLASLDSLRCSTVKNIGIPPDRFQFFVEEYPLHTNGACFLMDPLVLHTIELLQYKERMLQENVLTGSKRYTPEFPQKRCRPPFGERLPEQSRVECYLNLRKSLAALIAHVGFHDAEAEALESMVDVASEQLEALCATLKKVHERRLLAKESATSGALSQMLQMVNIGHVDELRKFYKRRVVNYHENIMKECLQLKEIKKETC